MESKERINIVLPGVNGRMGKTILALLQEHALCKPAALVVLPSELDTTRKAYSTPVFSSMDEALSVVEHPVIIDFTAPNSSMVFAKAAVDHGAAHVIGTTGLNDQQRALLQEYAKRTPLLWSPNMSVGINVLLEILPLLVQKLGVDYDMELVEIHHKKKKDAPSGTAVRLGEALAQARGWNYADTACYHREGIIGERPQQEIGMQTLRGGDVVGVHTVYFLGPGERLEITHQAHSRENFANGAIRAAAWLARQACGTLYSMQNVLADSLGE